MAPSNLQGLNIVQPIPPSNPYISDADLLSVPPFPDLNAHLDLWTNLNFQSDEPLVSSRPGENKKDLDAKGSDTSEDDADRYNDADEDLQRNGIAEAHSHENVVMGTVLPPTGAVHSPPRALPSGAPGQVPPFDINSLLAGFGIDPFANAPVHPAIAPNTLAQLLSLHAPNFLSSNAQSIPTSAHSSPQQQASAASSPTSASPTISTAATTTTKRARTSRGSVSSATETSPQPEPAEDKPSATPLTAAEDKRRRNTAASARFRLKKKEREAALERKAKELEVRVGELEKECEALRRENGWLKGLVVGVTGAGAAVQQQRLQHHAGVVDAGIKRPREDDA